MSKLKTTTESEARCDVCDRILNEAEIKASKTTIDNLCHECRTDEIYMDIGDYE